MAKEKGRLKWLGMLLALTLLVGFTLMGQGLAAASVAGGGIRRCPGPEHPVLDGRPADHPDRCLAGI